MAMQKAFFIGDSTSVRYGPWLERYLAPEVRYDRKSGLNDALRDLDVPQGQNAGDSTMVLEYLSNNKTHGEIQNVDLLVANCGLHDIKTDPDSGERQVGIDQYRSNLEHIVTAGRSLCKEFVWISTTPLIDAVHNARNEKFFRYRDQLLSYNEVAKDVMAAAGVPTIDLFGLTLELESDIGEAIYEDHVHFTPEVRRVQAAFVAGWVKGFARALTPSQ